MSKRDALTLATVLASLLFVSCKRERIEVGTRCRNELEIQCSKEASNGERLICIGGNWESVVCKDPCHTLGGTGSCLAANSGIGLPCLRHGQQACLDASTVLACDASNHWTRGETCAEGFQCSEKKAACEEKPPPAVENSKEQPGGLGCLPAAVRFRKKLDQCGLNVADVSREALCARMSADRLRFGATLDCNTIGTMISAR